MTLLDRNRFYGPLKIKTRCLLLWRLFSWPFGIDLITPQLSCRFIFIIVFVWYRGLKLRAIQLFDHSSRKKLQRKAF